MRVLTIAIALSCLSIACGGPQSKSEPIANTDEQKQIAKPAVDALAAGAFERAGTQAAELLAADSKNSSAAAVRAFVDYHDTVRTLFDDMGAVIESLESGNDLDHQRARQALEKTEASLAEIDKDLAVVAADPNFALELCLACWERDWNHNGRIDDGDKHLLEIEFDRSGESLPDGDARRRPTYRFDVGDAIWARAMLSFQRGLINMVLAYSWAEANTLMRSFFGSPPLIRIKLDDKKRMHTARDLFLQALDYSDQCRAAYLAETDNDREWVPSPRQTSYAAPLPVDEALYKTWEGVVRDLRMMLLGKEGLPLALIAEIDRNNWPRAPAGFVNIGKIFSEPSDINLDIASLNRINFEDINEVEKGLASFFGRYWEGSMQPTPLIDRLRRMRQELDRGEDSIDRKLRYLIWIN
jgi:hypothetical protein